MALRLTEAEAEAVRKLPGSHSACRQVRAALSAENEQLIFG